MHRCTCPKCREALRPSIHDLAARLDDLADDMADLASALGEHIRAVPKAMEFSQKLALGASMARGWAVSMRCRAALLEQAEG